MAHCIEDGPIKILKCITPGCYWVKCQSCRGTCRIPVSIRRKPFRGDFFPPLGSPVFVHDRDGFFYRGKICGQRENLDYTIQLTDTFQVKDFRLDCIYPTYGEELADCESAHMVSLQNILPALPPADFGAYSNNPSPLVSIFERKTREWDHLTCIAEGIVSKFKNVKFEATSSIRGSTYGTIFYCDSIANPEEKTLSGQVVFSRIAKRALECFADIVEILMSYPLHRGYKFLPNVYPYGLNVPIPRKRYEIPSLPPKELKVHEDDEDFYVKILNQGSFVLMLTQPPKDTETIVRFVMPNGWIALGSVAYARIDYCIDMGYVFHDLLRTRRLWNQYLRNQQQSDNQYPRGSMSNKMLLYCLSRVPPDWESDDASDEPTHGFVRYDFEDALRQFTHEGGNLELFAETKIEGTFAIDNVIRIMLANLNIETLRSWQKVMLPFLVKKKHAAIIGPKASLKLTTSLISIFTSMSNKASNQKSTVSISPRLVVFVPNFHRADHVSRLCLLLASPFKVIALTTIGFSATQQKDALGCDVIVTTPGNWLKLFDGSKGYFETVRLEFAVFDCFEKLSENASELNDVFKKVVANPAKRSIQTIMLLNSSCPNLSSCLKIMGSYCVCTVDSLVYSFSAGVKPTVVFASDDWDEHLIRIIETDMRSNRLLLCSDHHQVTAIESKIPLSYGVLYVHENLSNQQILDTLEVWKADKTKILVSSDVVFCQMEFTNSANLLISWNLNSREKLIKRLRSLSDHSLRAGSSVPVYLFCERNDLPSLLFIEDVLLGVKGIEFSNGNLSDLKKLAIESREKLLKSKYCSDFLSLGKCRLENCNHKHVMDSKKVTELDNHGCFIKMKSVKFHSAYHVAGQIEDIVLNQTSSDTPLLGMRSRSAIIENGLSMASKKPSIPDDQKLRLAIGTVVGMKLVRNDQVVLRRAKITSCAMEEKCVEIEFLDIDLPNEKISVENIFPVPKTIQILQPDLVHVYITDLKPTCPELDWCYETTAFVKMFVKLLENKVGDTNLNWLAGPVKATVGRQLLVGSFYPCSATDQRFVPYESIKELLVNSGFFVERADSIVIPSMHCEPLVKQMSGSNLKAGASGTPAVVSSYLDPGLVYIQLVEDSDSLDDFESRLNVAMDNDERRLPFLGLDEFCAVKREGSWNRAIVFLLSEPDLATIRYIDHGDSDTVNFSDLFCLPIEFANAIPPL